MNKILESAKELNCIVTEVSHLSSKENELKGRGREKKAKIREWLRSHNDKQKIKELIEQCPDKETYDGLKYAVCGIVNFELLIQEINEEFLKEKGVSIEKSFK